MIKLDSEYRKQLIEDIRVTPSIYEQAKRNFYRNLMVITGLVILAVLTITILQIPATPEIMFVLLIPSMVAAAILINSYHKFKYAKIRVSVAAALTGRIPESDSIEKDGDSTKI